MELVLRFLFIWNLLLIVETFEVSKECVVTSKWEGELNGSQMTVTSWLPEQEEEKDLKMEDPFLTLTLWNQNISLEYDIIDLGKSNASLTRSRGHKDTVSWIDFKEELLSGWIDLNLILIPNTSLDVWYRFHTKLFSVNAPLEYDTVAVRGTYVSVNCHDMMIGWSLTEEGGSSVVPLWEKDHHHHHPHHHHHHHHHHHLTLFSETFTRPSLSFPSSIIATPPLLLAWNGTSLYGIPNHPIQQEEDLQDLLPPFVQHNLTIFCLHAGNGVECDILISEEQISLRKMEFHSMPQNLRVTAPSTDRLFVFIHRLSPEHNQLTKAKQDREDGRVRTVGQKVSIVILAFVFFSIISLVLFSSIFHSRIARVHPKRPSIPYISPDEVEPFVSHHDSPRPLPRGSVIMEEQYLWEAVQEGDAEAVKSLLEEGYHPDEVELNRFVSSFMDAHMLGRKDIVQIFAEHKGEKFTTAPDDLIKVVLYELEKNMKEIFLAAEFGMYEHERGVGALLKAYCLPATISDSHGRSILHYMASVTVMDGLPVWQPKDIRKFFANHEYYANAVDNWGRTALHELSQHPQEAEVDVIWDGKEWLLADAWLAMARLLISYGCDPRIQDHKGQNPHQLAREAGNHELAKFLEQKCAELGNINPDEGIDQFDNLVSAVRRGDVVQMRKLLLCHVPLLPLKAQVDPLLEAIYHQHRDAVFLLLIAGAPLCNRSVGGVTPLEAAHNTLGLPACFPALLRKAYCERMEDEITKVAQEDEALKPLRQCMSAYNLQVMDVGSKARWIFPTKERVDRCREARNLLVQVAELGLSFTCMVLGLEDVYLHSLSEEPNAFHKSITNKQLETQLVLYRELGMSPFTLDSTEDFHWQLLEIFWINELKALESICLTVSKKDKKFILENAVIKLQRLRSNGIWDREDDTEENMDLLLCVLAKHGLITIIHVLFTQFTHINVDKIIEKYCRYTMLHVAAAFGRMSIIEYLLHRGATLDVLCIGNYTPAHVAAITGHKKCFEYIFDFMKYVGTNVNTRCHVGLTAEETMMKYEALCSDCSLPLISHESALFIRNENVELTKTYEMLQRKGTILGISTSDDLLQTAKAKLCKRSDTEIIERIIEEEVQNFGELISKSGCEGKYIPVGSFHEGHEVFSVDQIDFLFEVSDIDSHEDINYEDVEIEGRITMAIESDCESSIYIGDTFVNSFVQIIRTQLLQFKPTSSEVSLVPPFVGRASDGAYLFWLLNYNEHIKLIRTCIKPVLPVTCPYDDINNTLPSKLSSYAEAKSDIPLHLINDFGEWIYCAYNLEKVVFQNLSKDQRAVWITCHLLARLLQSTWWSPSFDFRSHSNPWHTLSLGLPSLLPEKGLKTLFLEELVHSHQWKKEHLFERVISIFRRACKLDMRKKLVPKEYINSFMTPRHFCCYTGESICGILQYLEALTKAEPQVLDKVVKFAEP